MFERAILHDGFSVVECLSECVMFYAGTFKMAENLAPGKFGVYYQVNRPTKNALEQKWIDETQSKLGGISQKEILKKRFEAMR